MMYGEPWSLGDLDKATERLLLAYFAPLSGGGGVIETLMLYVRDGRKPEVLEAISKQEGASRVGVGQAYGSHPARDALFSGANLSAVQWMRLGNVLARLFASTEKGVRMLRGLHWPAFKGVRGALGTLMREAELNDGDKSGSFYTMVSFERLVRTFVKKDEIGFSYNWFKDEMKGAVYQLGSFRDFSEWWSENFPEIWREFSLRAEFCHIESYFPRPKTLEPMARGQVLTAIHDVAKRRLANPKDLNQIAWTLRSLCNYEIDLSPYATQILDLAMQSNQWVSGNARRALDQMPDQALAHLEPLLKNGSPKQRARANTLLSGMHCPAAAALLDESIKSEKTKSVRLVLDYLADERRLYASPDVSQALREHAKQAGIETGIALPSELRCALQEYLFQKAGDGESAKCSVESALARIESAEVKHERGYAVPQVLLGKWTEELLTRVFDHDDLTLVHVAQIATLASDRFRVAAFTWHDGDGRPNWLPGILIGYAKRRPGLCALDLLAAFTLIGVSPEALVDAFVCNLTEDQWSVLDRSKLDRFLCEHPHLLIPRLRLQGALLDVTDNNREYRVDAYAYLASMETLPEPLVRMIVHRSFDEAKELRTPMQQSVAKFPGLAQIIEPYLNAGPAKIRIQAAAWLGTLAQRSSIEALQLRLEKEKNALVRSELVKALASMEVSTPQPSGSEHLLEEALANLPKKLPQNIRWFPFDRLPDLRWKASKDLVDPRILKSWILYAVARGEAEPDDQLKRYIALLDPKDAALWGQALMLAWVLADSCVAGEFERAQLSAGAYLQTHWELTDDRLKPIAQWFEQEGKKVEASIIFSRGILALVVETRAVDAIGLAQNYVQCYATQRLAQCRVILDAVSLIDCDVSAQTLAMTVRQARSRPVKAHARKALLSLADRKGWSPALLNDKMIPRAMLDDQGQRLERFGSRSFRIELDPDLKIKVRDEKGTLRTGLTAMRKGELPQVYEIAKHRVARARRQVKNIEKLQRQRFEDAMLMERAWTTLDWQQCLLEHPIMVKLAPRMIWRATDSEGQVQYFRPLGDGTLSTVDDDAWTLPVEAKVQIAHANHLTKAQLLAWRAHIADYEVKLWLDQLVDPWMAPPLHEGDLYLLPEAQASVDLLYLRNHAKAWGFEREPFPESLRFTRFTRRYEDFGVEASLVFSGADVPMTSQEVQVQSMEFASADARSGWHQLELSKLSALLLAHSAQALAAMGGVAKIVATRSSEGPGQAP